ncbi:hypothetical protein GCM10023238_39730 [Streptomyces heliomycini]
MLDAEVAIVGAGAAGLSLAHRLSRTAPDSRAPAVVLVDAPPGPLRPPRRTWCYWEAGAGRFDAAVTATWRHLRVRPPAGPALDGDIAPLRYKMIRPTTSSGWSTTTWPPPRPYAVWRRPSRPWEDVSGGALVHWGTVTAGHAPCGPAGCSTHAPRAACRPPAPRCCSTSTAGSCAPPARSSTAGPRS